jgi:hypothetical protein
VRAAVLSLGEPLQPPRLVGQEPDRGDEPGAAHRMARVADEAAGERVDAGEA